MYRQGYFRQRIDAGGVQHEYWVDADPRRLPAALVHGPDGLPLTLTVPIRAGDVTVQIWRVDVGRVPLYLLDADRPENDLIGRWTTARLYSADTDTRLAQYALLGVGGMRALAALGIEPGVIHLNEGHAALAFLETTRAEMEAGASLAAAWDAARLRTVFTTHTPVPAGNDTYPAWSGHRDARLVRGGDRPRRRRARTPGAHASRRSGRALRDDAVRAAHEPQRQRSEPPPRRGRAR